MPGKSLKPLGPLKPGRFARFRSLPRSRLAALALACALVGGGAPAAYATFGQDTDGSAGRTARADGGRPYQETRLLFGTVRPDGGPDVSEADFRRFTTQAVTPRFPEGLTVQEGHGQYRDAHGTIERERSYEVTLYYPEAEVQRNAAKIEAIRDAYVKLYDQESVARVDDRASVDF